MLEWCMAHYWMTFWIIIFFIYTVSIVINNIFIIQNNKVKLQFKEIEESKKDENPIQ